MLPIQKKLIRYNYSTRNDKIKYIVIHTTGNTGKGAGVNSHFNYFNGDNRGASADYFVDDRNIAMFIEDKNYSWHCGDGRGRYGITNENSIGIEICVNSDSNYNKAIENTVDLVQHLLKKYGLSISTVKRHFDASRKQCPREIIQCKNGITWGVFLDKVQNKDDSIQVDKPIIDEIFRVRENEKGEQFGVFSDLDNAIICAKENNAVILNKDFKIIKDYRKEAEKYMSKVYKNGSTRENVYSDEKLKDKIGSLNPYESCEAIADINGKIVVLYNTQNGKKTGFVKYRAGL